MENGPFEDVFPIEHCDFLLLYVSLPEGVSKFLGPFNFNRLLNFEMNVFAICLFKHHTLTQGLSFQSLTCHSRQDDPSGVVATGATLKSEGNARG